MKAVKREVRDKLDSADTSEAIIRKYYKLQKAAVKQCKREGPFASRKENLRLRFVAGLLEVARKIHYYRIKRGDDLKDIIP